MYHIGAGGVKLYSVVVGRLWEGWVVVYSLVARGAASWRQI